MNKKKYESPEVELVEFEFNNRLLRNSDEGVNKDAWGNDPFA